MECAQCGPTGLHLGGSALPCLVQINGLKTYLDGTLGSRTAYMREPFLNNEPGKDNWRGLLREGVEGGQLERNLRAAAKAGLQSIAHCIGDEANHMLLNALAAEYDDLSTARCRSEHAQHLLPTDIQRFGDLGVINRFAGLIAEQILLRYIGFVCG